MNRSGKKSHYDHRTSQYYGVQHINLHFFSRAIFFLPIVQNSVGHLVGVLLLTNIRCVNCFASGKIVCTCSLIVGNAIGNVINIFNGVTGHNEPFEMC